jgi:uncharacterized protein (DUF362 family)
MNAKFTRRTLLPLAGAGLLAGFAGFELRPQAKRTAGRRANVSVQKVNSYDQDFAGLISTGGLSCGLDVKDKKVLVNVQLEGFDAGHALNADASVVAGTVAALWKLGATEVLVGAGPSMERDTLSLAEAAGYMQAIPDFGKVFVDLNRSDVSPVEGVLGGPAYLPTAALRADLIVSVAKMKTDASTGVWLSLANMVGLAPGAVYGWPKDGFQSSAALMELARIFRRSFAIVDGIVGMEGNGPLAGTPKNAQALVVGDDLTAADATCCRVMGINPAQVDYLRRAADSFGVMEEEDIRNHGQAVPSLRVNFALPERQGELRLG